MGLFFNNARTRRNIRAKRRFGPSKAQAYYRLNNKYQKRVDSGKAKMVHTRYGWISF